MIKIICVGKLKEKYLIDLVNDYAKRINKYHKLQIIELEDSNIDKERDLIQKHINKEDYLIGLFINGETYTSEEFSQVINNLFINGKSNITFIIGGSDGIHKDIESIIDKKISFSKLTFPHGLFRGILLEQIYRNFKIINNEKYHK